MRHQLSCIAIGVFLLASPAGAQQRTYVRGEIAVPSLPEFLSPSSAELGRLLRGGSLVAPPSTAAELKARVRLAIDSLRLRRRTCPMPVVVPDSTRYAKGPGFARDSDSKDPMPVLAPACENPLGR